MRRLALVLALGVAVLLPTGTVHADTSTTVRLTGPIVFMGGPAECAVARAQGKLYAGDGRLAGFLRACYQDYTAGEGYQVFEGTAALHLHGGVVLASIVNREDFRSDTVADSTWTGTVLSGTGRYRGATGTLAGAGQIVFDAAGDPHPDIVFTLTLS